VRRSNFEEDGKGRPIVKYRDCVLIRAKTAETNKMLFGMWVKNSKEACVKWECTLAQPEEYD